MIYLTFISLFRNSNLIPEIFGRNWDSLSKGIHLSLNYEVNALPSIHVPDSYSFSAVSKSDSKKITEYCAQLNLNFLNIKGHTETKEQDIIELFRTPTYMPNGLMLLEYKKRPIGTLYVCRDEDDLHSANIEMLSVHPEYRHRGLGRLLLRKAIQFAFSNKLNKIYLSVNAESESAVSLYLSEGFESEEVAVCYGLHLK